MLPNLANRYDPAAIGARLDAMKPQHACVWFISPDAPHDKTAYFVDTLYQVSKMTPVQIARWRHLQRAITLSLSAFNPYIANNFNLICNANHPENPETLIDKPGLRLHYMPSRTFADEPGMDIRLNFRNGTTMGSARNQVLCSLNDHLSNLELAELSNQAYVGGISFSFYVNNSLTIKASLHIQCLVPLVNARLDRYLVIAPTAQQLQQGKTWYRQQLDGTNKSKVYSQAIIPAKVLSDILYIERDARRPLIDGIMLQRDDGLLRNAYQTYRGGRAGGGESDPRAGENASAWAAGELELTGAAWRRLIKATVNESLWTLIQKRLDSTDFALAAVYIPLDYDRIEEMACSYLVSQIVKCSFYKQLRTQKQLDYVVFMLSIFVGDRAGIGFVLQSCRYQSTYLYQRYLAFFTQTGQRLNTLDPTDFEQYKQGVIAQLKQKPQTLGEEMDLYTDNLDRDNMRFDTCVCLIARLWILTQPQLNDYLQRAVIKQQGLARFSQISGGGAGNYPGDYAQPTGLALFFDASALQRRWRGNQRKPMGLITAENLNPLTLPLQGARLIEASAGTGKTYTLAALYLRLLLGLGGDAAYPRPLSVEEILVVTFTEAATEELRGRIRDNIHRLRLACVRGKSKDPLLAALLAQLGCMRRAGLHLLAAERQMDEAAIYTIHGFCQRILNHNAVESGMLFQQTLLEDELFLRQQVSADFWRRHCYPLPLDVARMVQQHWEGPENLLTELLPYLQGEPPVVRNPPDISESILSRHGRIIAGIEDLKRQWRAASATLRTMFDEHKLDRRVYSSRNLSTWLAKVDRWASEPTMDYKVPDKLAQFKSSVLAEKTTAGEPPRHELFTAVEAFYQQRLSLRELIFVMALAEMRQALEQEKRRRAEMGFDDLLSCLDRALAGDGGEALAASVRTRYPVAMIDEFQDTDPQQYRIFRRIYGDQPGCGILLIGDPKQAIYAFRGADIFTYMRARSEVDAHYTLDTNWRSAPGMINAVNQLFQSLPAPFIFNDISFLPVASAADNIDLRLVVRHQPQPALRVWLQPGAGVGVSKYQQYMARQCAATICDWLYAARDGEAWLEKRQGRQQLQASDITVLVRNRNEAALIRDALAALMIPAVYLSNRDSVFETLEARELQWILQAVLTPEKDTALRRALATGLLGFDAATIDALNNDERRWEQRIEEFADYRQRWQKTGVLPMLRQMMINHDIAENLLASQGGERRLTDVLHLGELLQEASTQLENEFAVVRWLALQVESPNPQATNQQLRPESDRHMVKIITVHKSKGLEFPLVFLPFAADFRVQKRPLFHDRQAYGTCLDLSAAQESLRLAEEERLAEDLRLFYVALTRSIYHCSLGIAPLYRGSRKKTGASDLHLSAPGYLIQQGQDGDADDLHDRLVALVVRADGDIALCEAQAEPAQPLIPASEPAPALSARNCPSLPHDPWRVTSYSGLQRHGSSVVMELQPRLDVDVAGNGGQQKRLQLTPHTFPRGVSSGTFLHGLFETLDFNRPLDPQWLSEQLAQQGIDAVWLPVLTHWMETIIAMPLDGRFLSLAHLAPDNCLAELPFYLAIDTVVQARDLDLLCKHYDPLSARCPPLNFPRVKGILKGFIDLVFRWQGRYYLLDYKSNWLGEESATYTLPAMEQAMIAHRYELQYQLYTLALHRFLRHRLVNYDYQCDFGGVYYLFLRGIDPAQPGNGVFHCRPDMALIDGLDRLFTGETHPAAQSC